MSLLASSPPCSHRPHRPSTLRHGVQSSLLPEQGSAHHDDELDPDASEEADRSPQIFMPPFNAFPTTQIASRSAGRLGTLTITDRSLLPSLVIHVDRASNWWGRKAGNTMDMRIPKVAFVIFWYAPGHLHHNVVREAFERGNIKDIADFLRPGIMTKATFGIRVNRIRLRQTDHQGRVLYGDLHTGDVIQVYCDSIKREYLEFKCNFNVGWGKNRRGNTAKFQVKVDKRSLLYQAR